MSLTSPKLWVVATPLGNPGDLSPRAREVLEGADMVLAEDTRRAGLLCQRCGVKAKRFMSFHDHNEESKLDEVLGLLNGGRTLALISDAGLPLVADPGYRLVRACRAAGIPVSVVPGPSAPVTALAGSGIAPQLFDESGQFLSTLILSPPGGGKTTLLRDLIRSLSLGDSEHRALRVAVIDERGEIAVCCRARPQMELGNHTDVLSLCPKATGIMMVLRGMNPQLIAVDEITAAEDIRAMCLAANCGVGLLASIHAASAEELTQKPLFEELLRAKVFRRCVSIRKEGGRRTYEVGELPCCT